MFSPFIVMTVIFLCGGTVRSLVFESDFRTASRFEGENIEIVAVIDECVYSEAYASLYYATLTSLEGISCGGTVSIEFPYETDLSPFDTVTLMADASDARKGKGLSEIMEIISKNRVLELEVTELISSDGSAKHGFMYSIYRLRTAINDRLSEALDPGADSYARALVLGDKSGLSLEFTSDMSALGISHILAVSGIHMSIIAGFVMTMCEKLRLSKRFKSVIIALCALSFMFIAGLSPSVMRATIMLIISLLPYFFGKKGDSITSLFCAAFVICLVAPCKILSCSFLLSFSACLAIVVCIPALDRDSRDNLSSARNGRMKPFYKHLRKLISSVGVSVCCSLVTVPVMALYFGRISYISFLTNLVAVPVATLSVSLLIPLLAFADVPVVGGLTAAAFSGVYGFLRGFAEIATSFGKTVVSLNYPFFLPIMIFLAVCFLYIRLSGIIRRFAMIAPFLICAVIFTASVQVYNVANRGRAEAVYMSNKTSEGFLVASGTKTLYIDIGNGGKALPLEGTELSDKRYCTVGLEGFMLTHYHSGHISSVRYLVLRYSIECFYLPEPENEKDAEILENLRNVIRDSEIIMYRRGETVSFGNVSVRTGEYCLLERSTHPVLTLEIGLYNKRILWLGSSVTESGLANDCEEALTGSEAVICGTHGPVMKENIGFYSVPPENILVFCSPYSESGGYGLEGAQVLTANSEGLVICVCVSSE